MKALDDSWNCQTLGVSPAELGAYELLVKGCHIFGIYAPTLQISPVCFLNLRHGIRIAMMGIKGIFLTF